jgi:aspartyl protease family protein
MKYLLIFIFALLAETTFSQSNTDDLINKAIEHARQSDYRSARLTFETAAAKGNPYAMHTLGQYYEIGLGCEENHSTALEWFTKAQKAGYENSDKDIQRIKGKAAVVQTNTEPSTPPITYKTTSPTSTVPTNYNSTTPTSKPSTIETSTGSNVVRVKKKHGVYAVPVIINGVLKIDFIFDSGASDVSISPDIALTLYKTETIKDDDWLEGVYYKFADGSTAKSSRFILHSIKIGNKTLYNVECSISNSIDAPMLLGQSCLSRLGKYTFDNVNQTLVIE